MRLSHSFSIDPRKTSGLPRWVPLLAALIVATALANAQTPSPGDTNRDDAPMRALEHTFPATTNDAALLEDQAQPMNPPEPNDAGSGRIFPPPDDNTVDAPPAAPGEDPQSQHSPSDVLATPSSPPVSAKSSKAISANPRAQAKTKEKTSTPGDGGSSSTTRVATDFSAFKIISDRNIFDPNRSPRRTGGPTRRAKSVESVTLVGILSYEKGDFAFFNSSSSEHKKVLKASDTIAGFKLASIGANSVKLSAGRKEVELKIGSQLRREEEGEWTLSAQSEASPATPAASLSSAAKPSEAGAASESGESEVLKKLRQRREQE
jgi:hypothetical protein